MEEYKSLTKKEVYHIFSRWRYHYLEDKRGLYLPDYKDVEARDQAITFDYLFDVLTYEAFSIQRRIIKKLLRRKRTCFKSNLKRKSEQITNQKCHFPPGKPPSKQ